MGFFSVVLMACFCAAIGHASATDPVLIRQDMKSGRYDVAEKQGRALETADGYALAAEALLTEVMLGRAEKNKKQSKRARKLAESALEMDATHQNARLQYAIADGFITRETGNVSAWMKKLPQKTEAVVQAYRTDFPSDPRGDALLGAWHLAIARETGDQDAKKWFGASIETGRNLFMAARMAEPDELVIGLNYAFLLIALKDKDLDTTTEARDILQQVVLITPNDHLDETLKGYAVEALARLDDRDAARNYVGMFLDGKTPT